MNCKTIKFGLLVQDLDSDYAKKLVEGIKNFCLEHNIQLIIFIIRNKNWPLGIFDYQHYASTSLATNHNLDGLLVITPTYFQNYTKKDFKPLLDELNYIPLVSIGVEVPGYPSVMVDTKPGVKEILTHLTDCHHRKSIAIMLPKSDSTDITDRMIAYKEFLAERNIPFDSSKVFYSQYIFDSAIKTLTNAHITKDNCNFDAIFAAVDDLAFGCIDYLTKQGFKIPEDISITGYDNLPRSSLSELPLTTIDQNLNKQGYLAAKILLEFLSTKQVKSVRIPSEPILRLSCGCSRNDEINIKESHHEVISLEGEWLHTREILSHFQFFLQEMQSTVSLEEFKSLMITDLRGFGIESCIICLYDDPIQVKRNENFVIPDKARILLAYNSNKDFSELDFKELCPVKEMYPQEFHFTEKKEIVTTVIFNTCFQYGYALYTPSNIDTRVFELIFTAAGIALSSNRLLSIKERETKKLADENRNLEVISSTDPLTNVLNRNGFTKYGEKTLALARSSGNCGMIIFGDMDHLKTINDTYGHEAGDRAIKIEIEMMKTVFRASDLFGRLGGDEFAVIAVGMKEHIFNRTKQRLDEASQKMNNTGTEPFKISISLGGAFFSADSNETLEELIKLADTRQYEEKKRRHAQR